MFRTVIHLNIADFAARLEACRTPSLKGEPLIVAPLGAPRARVFDMSDKAFQEGIRKGMPLSRALRRHPAMPVLPPRPDAYARAMKDLTRQARSFSDRIEAGQADGHLFLDITGTGRLLGPGPDVALRLKKAVQKHLGLDPIWTLATSKLVAKTASRLVKPLGEYIVGPGEEATFLAPLPVSLLPGLTQEEQAILDRFNIRTVSQARQLTLAQLALPFGQRAPRIHDLLWARDSEPVNAGPGPCPALLETFEFDDDTNDSVRLRAGLARIIARICTALRRADRLAGTLTLTLCHSDGIQAVRSGRFLLDSEGAMLSQAWDLLLRTWTRRTRIRSICITCAPVPRPPVQAPLFEGPDHGGPGRGASKYRQAARAIDRIRERFGDLALQPGTALNLAPPQPA